MTSSDPLADPLAPYFTAFWPACAQQEPALFVTGGVIGGASALLAVVLSLRHQRDLARTPPSARRTLSLGIVQYATVFATVALFGLYIPRGSFLWAELLHVAEAIVLARFAELILLLIYISPADGAVGETPPPSSHGGIWETDEAYYAKCVAALQRIQPLRLLASPPLGCYFVSAPCLPCSRPMQMSMRMLSCIRLALKALTISLPVVAIIRLWSRIAYAGEKVLLSTTHYILFAVQLLVTLVAIYALVILYRASYGLVRHHRVTHKFAAIKMVVFLSTLQHYILFFTFEMIERSNSPSSTSSCAAMMRGAVRGQWIESLISACEAPLLVWLHRYAYPERELELEGEPLTAGGGEPSVSVKHSARKSSAAIEMSTPLHERRALTDSAATSAIESGTSRESDRLERESGAHPIVMAAEPDISASV